ncbi:MAG TPA: CGNR zinc finger domain-containing protein [Actinomycetota bacterium]|nr:CGNR zinc finger domain-containing protein [Actinomycetota bacterium]
MSDHDGTPGGLDLVAAFVNTDGVDRDADDLATPELLVAWARRRGLGPVDALVTEDDAARARSLRAGLRAALAVHGGDAVGDVPLRRLDGVAAGVDLRVRFEGSEPRLVPGGRGADAVLGAVLAAAYSAAAAGTWTRLKACVNDRCGWVFYDRSKNRSRRWCAMSACGNVAKAREYRRRKASERSTTAARAR